MMEKLHRYALGTGSAKVIERSIARELGRQSNNLLLTHRDSDDFTDVKSALRTEIPEVTEEFLMADLSQTHQLEEIFLWSLLYHNQLETVVSYAFFGSNGLLVQLDRLQFRRRISHPGNES